MGIRRPLHCSHRQTHTQTKGGGRRGHGRERDRTTAQNVGYSRYCIFNSKLIAASVLFAHCFLDLSESCYSRTAREQQKGTFWQFSLLFLRYFSLLFVCLLSFDLCTTLVFLAFVFLK